MNIQPPGAASATFDGAVNGGGAINISCAGTFSFCGGTGSNSSYFSGTINMQQPGTLRFLTASDAPAQFTGPINSTGPIVHDGPGQTILMGNNAYSGGITINQGVLYIYEPVNASFLASNITNNAILQIGCYTVAANYSGAMSGAGMFTKTMTNALTLSGTTSNAYNGGTYLRDGTLILAKTAGAVAIPAGVLTFEAHNANSYLLVSGDNQISPSCAVNFIGGIAGSSPHFEVLGHNVTVAGIADSYGTAVIENAQDQSSAAGTLTVNNSNNYSFNGIMRDHNAGTGTLALVKGGGGA